LSADSITPSGDTFHASEVQDHPHACEGGYVFLGYTETDPETGEDVERVEALPCRRCTEASEDRGTP
jgi:hypothetical protein